MDPDNDKGIKQYDEWKEENSSQWLLGFANCLYEIIEFCPELTLKGILDLRRSKNKSMQQQLSAYVASKVKSLVRESFISLKNLHGLSWWMGLTQFLSMIN